MTISGFFVNYYQLIQMKNYTPPPTPCKFKEEQPIEITYSYQIDQQAGNIIKGNDQFIKYMSKNKILTIEGDKDDLFLFNIENNSYKLRGVFLPTTMLVTDPVDQTQLNSRNGTGYDNFSDTPFKSSKKVSHVHLQTGNYLKIQPYIIEYNLLYANLKDFGVAYKQFNDAQSINDLLNDFGMPLSQIRSKFKITSSQFELMIKQAPVASFLPKQISFIQEPYYIFLELGLMVGLLRNIIPFLMENGKIGEWFTYNEISSAVKIGNQKILMVIAKIFQLQTNYPHQQSYSLEEKMDIQEDPFQRRYKLTLTAILRFILLEMASEKMEYAIHEMDSILENMLKVYLPIGLDEFQQNKAHAKMLQVIGLHFLTITKGSVTTRKYYDPLLIDSTIKGRIQFMSGYKKKFTFWQIKGMFSKLITKDNIDINDILMKNFRKCGNNEYEIKLIIPN